MGKKASGGFLTSTSVSGKNSKKGEKQKTTQQFVLGLWPINQTAARAWGKKTAKQFPKSKPWLGQALARERKGVSVTGSVEFIKKSFGGKKNP